MSLKKQIITSHYTEMILKPSDLPFTVVFLTRGQCDQMIYQYGLGNVYTNTTTTETDLNPLSPVI